jgi:hypothetical protein
VVVSDSSFRSLFQAKLGFENVDVSFRAVPKSDVSDGSCHEGNEGSGVVLDCGACLVVLAAVFA